MKLLVCGGRDYQDSEHVHKVLYKTVPNTNERHCIITGRATGADFHAMMWARDNGVAVHTYRAKWEEYGKAAGPIRNKEMLDNAKPDLVLAFPGNNGTADMVRQALDAGVPVRYCCVTHTPNTARKSQATAQQGKGRRPVQD